MKIYSDCCTVSLLLGMLETVFQLFRETSHLKLSWGQMSLDLPKKLAPLMLNLTPEGIKKYKHICSPVKMCANQQLCHLQAIICCLLHTGVPEEPPSRQKDPLLAAHFFCYVMPANHCDRAEYLLLLRSQHSVTVRLLGPGHLKENWPITMLIENKR